MGSGPAKMQHLTLATNPSLAERRSGLHNSNATQKQCSTAAMQHSNNMRHSSRTAQHSTAQHSTAQHSTAQHSTTYLEEAILSQRHKSNGCCGDEHTSNGDEAADEDKQAQQANPRDVQYPHAQHCQGSVGHCNLCLHCRAQQWLLQTSKQNYSNSTAAEALNLRAWKAEQPFNRCRCLSTFASVSEKHHVLQWPSDLRTKGIQIADNLTRSSSKSEMSWIMTLCA